PFRGRRLSRGGRAPLAAVAHPGRALRLLARRGGESDARRPRRGAATRRPEPPPLLPPVRELRQPEPGRAGGELSRAASAAPLDGTALSAGSPRRRRDVATRPPVPAARLDRGRLLRDPP